MRNLSDATLQLELEKAQRLARMIEAEIRWRRTLQLEKEARKEMILQREMAMRGFLPKAPPALPQNSCFGLLGLNAFNMASSPRPAETNVANMKRKPEGSKVKLIVLPKPNQTHFEGKRKAGMEENYEFSFESKKKAKVVKAKDVKEWRCELCNITTTSEKVLSGHFKGKKHMAKANAQSRKMEEEEVEDDSKNSGVKSV